MRSQIPVCALLIVWLTAGTQGAEKGWHPGIDEARRAAAGSRKPMLIHFHAWYCGPCQRMDREVFSREDVQQLLSHRLAAVKIDITQEPDIAGTYRATTVPRDVVVFPDGTHETVNIGYMNRSSYLTLLNDIASRSEKGKSGQNSPGIARLTEEKPVPAPRDADARTPQAESAGQNGMNDIPSIASVGDQSSFTPPARATIPSLTDEGDGIFSEPPIIGLEGFCPVQLIKNREWTPGQSGIMADYRDIRYRFASESDREEFLENPARYAPQDLGCDPVVLASDRRAMPGSIRYGAFFDERLYLFRSAENRAEFRKNPLQYSQLRSAVRVEQLEGIRFN